MQRLAGTRLLAPARTRPTRQPWERQFRFQSFWSKPVEPGTPMREKFPLYQISELVLDLDAEGTKHVRKYDPDLDGEPSTSTAQSELDDMPLRALTAEFEKEYIRNSSEFKNTLRDKFSPWHVSDHDMISVALLGTSLGPEGASFPEMLSHKSGISCRNSLETVLSRNGIPDRARDSNEKLLAYMLRRQTLERRKRLRPEDATMFRERLTKSDNLQELSRMSSSISQSVEGCQLISDHRSEVLGAIRRLQLNNSESSQDILRFLTNITLKVYNHGFPMESELYAEFLGLAIEHSAFPAAHLYLQLVYHASINAFTQESGQAPEPIISVLRNLQERIMAIVMGEEQDKNSALTSQGRLEAYFCLLTGERRSEKLPQPSIRNLISTPNDYCYQLYLRAIASMGAIRTLWHEYNTNTVGFADKEWNPEEKLDVFANAFHHLPEGYQISRPEAQDEVYLDATGDYRLDCRLDVENTLHLVDTHSIGRFPETKLTSVEYLSLRKALGKLDAERALLELRNLWFTRSWGDSSKLRK